MYRLLLAICLLMAVSCGPGCYSGYYETYPYNEEPYEGYYNYAPYDYPGYYGFYYPGFEGEFEEHEEHEGFEGGGRERFERGGGGERFERGRERR